MIPTGTKPHAAYAVYKDGHAEALGGYHFSPHLPATVVACSIWNDQAYKLEEGLMYMVVEKDGSWWVCNPSTFGGTPKFNHVDLDAALMWASLNL